MDSRRISGFSLIELMITIAVVAILLALAFPSFEGSMRSNRVASASNELMASFSLARTEGLRSPGGAVVCTSTNGSTCGGDWNDGWIVWIDANGDGAPGGANDRVLRHVQALNRMDISATSPGGATAANRIVFDNRGRVDTHTREIVLQPDSCPAGGPYRRELDIALTGQVKLTRGVCP